MRQPAEADVRRRARGRGRGRGRARVARHPAASPKPSPRELHTTEKLTDRYDMHTYVRIKTNGPNPVFIATVSQQK